MTHDRLAKARDDDLKSLNTDRNALRATLANLKNKHKTIFGLLYFENGQRLSPHESFMSYGLSWDMRSQGEMRFV